MILLFGITGISASSTTAPIRTHRTNAITGYDCALNSSPRVRLDTIHPAPCHHTPVHHVNKTQQWAQIIRSRPSFTIQAIQCVAYVTRTTTRCRDKYSRGHQYPHIRKYLDFTGERCIRALRTNLVHLDDRTHSVKPGLPQVFSYTSHGRASRHGECIPGKKFHRDHVWYDHSIEQTQLWVQLLPLNITVSATSSSIDIPTTDASYPSMAAYNTSAPHQQHSGEQFQSFRSFQNGQHSQVAWENPPDPPCDHQFETLYNGKVTSHLTNQPSGRSRITSFTNSRLLRSHTKAGFLLGNSVLKCDQECQGTQIPDTFICFYDQATTTPMPLAHSLSNTLSTSMTRAFWLERQALKSQLYEAHTLDTLQAQNCQLEQENVKTRLRAIAHGDVTLLTTIMGLGHNISGSGKTITINKCQPVAASATPHTRWPLPCFPLQTVLVDQKPYTINPISHLVTPQHPQCRGYPTAPGTKTTNHPSHPRCRNPRGCPTLRPSRLNFNGTFYGTGEEGPRKRRFSPPQQRHHRITTTTYHRQPQQIQHSTFMSPQP